MLTSPQNPRVKLARQLQDKRDVREAERLFVAEGARLTDDFLQAGFQAAFALIGTQAAAKQWQREHPQVESIEVSDTLMRDISVEKTPPGILLVLHMPHADLAGIAPREYDLILVLDRLRDPGNMGACLRVAAGADCRLVLLTPGCVDAYNPKVVRGGMGAHARLKITSLAWDEIAQVCKGCSIWAAEAGAERRYDEVPWTEPSTLIIGGESSGISDAAHRISTAGIAIPLANRVESLNAAVACGVILFEAARQRRSR